jgi:methionyl-tRNA formyltransferase
MREGLSLLRPERVGDPLVIERLAELTPDLGVVVAFGQFLPRQIRELPSYGYLINAHASLLPKYRGASPIAQAILLGESETGISVMRIEREMDAGPVAWVERTPIGAQENTAELSARLAEIAADAIAKTLDTIARGEVVWTQQDAERATLAPKLEKADGLLDLRQSAQSLARRIHALSPRPAGSVWLAAGGKQEILKLSRAEVQCFEPGELATPGTIQRDSGGHPLRIATGEGWLVPLVIQQPGGRAMPVGDFLRGYPLPDGARFAAEPAATETETR